MSRAFRVTFRKSSTEESGSSSAETGLEWVTEENGKEVSYYHEPKTGLWRRITTKILSLIAPEKML
jgi:hypothetical protein